MISNTLKAIKETKSKLAALEKKAADEQKKRIVNLHKDAGFATRGELIAALQALGGGKKRGRKAAAAPKAKKGAKKRAKRTLITPELKKGIIAALKAGGKGAAVAAKFGVSVPTLHNIKKAAGLTKSRGAKKAAKKAVAKAPKKAAAKKPVAKKAAKKAAKKK